MAAQRVGDRAEPGEGAERARRRQQRQRVPRRRGVDDDQVVHAAAEPPRVEPGCELLQHEELRAAPARPPRAPGSWCSRAGGGSSTRKRSMPWTKSPSASSGSTVATDRPGDTTRRLRAACVAPSSARAGRVRPRPRARAGRAARGRTRQRGRHGALPDAALAGHHDQPLRVQGEATRAPAPHSGAVRGESISPARCESGGALDLGQAAPSSVGAGRRRGRRWRRCGPLPRATAPRSGTVASRRRCRGGARSSRKEKGASSSDSEPGEGVGALGPAGGRDRRHREGLARVRRRPGVGSGCGGRRDRPAGTRGECRGRTARAPHLRRSGPTGECRSACAARLPANHDGAGWLDGRGRKAGAKGFAQRRVPTLAAAPM